MAKGREHCKQLTYIYSNLSILLLLAPYLNIKVY